MIANAPELPVSTPASTNPANEIAKKLTGWEYVSWSAISTFRTCPLKYKFRYIDGLPEESVSSALVFGTGIHSAVEQHFQAILSGEEQPDVERLMFAYRSAWLPHDPEAISFGSTETRASLDALAGKMLTEFLSSPAASVQGRVPGVEEHIREVEPGNVKHTLAGVERVWRAIRPATASGYRQGSQWQGLEGPSGLPRRSDARDSGLRGGARIDLVVEWSRLKGTPGELT